MGITANYITFFSYISVGSCFSCSGQILALTGVKESKGKGDTETIIIKASMSTERFSHRVSMHQNK